MTRRSGPIAVAAVLALIQMASLSRADLKDAPKKMQDARAVLQELLGSTDRGVPQELLENAKCVAVIPGVFKAALGYGVRHGKGVMSCRTASGWTTPSFVNINGGSAGFQIGAESTDLVLFFMNERGVRALVNGAPITLGGKASVAAGPFGRSGEASTNLTLKAEIYSYARSKGLFAGISVEGAKLSPDNEDNREYYGRGVTAQQILFGHAPENIPPDAEAFRKTLP